MTLLILTYFGSMGQNAGNTLDMEDAPVVFTNSTLINNFGGNLQAFTIEIWIKPADVEKNQKLFNKVDVTFDNGYILGINEGELDFEIFDYYGEKNQLKGGKLAAGVWQHVAATFNSNGKIELLINGKIVADMTATIDFLESNTNDLVIGMASWDKVSFGYTGEMDEIRFWRTDLTPTEITNHINLEAVLPSGQGQHPKQGFLQLYLKCDEASGNGIIDSSPVENPPGSTPFRFRKASTVPFKGSPAFVQGNRTIGGVWTDQSDYTLVNMDIEGQNLTGDQSAIIESNISTQDFCNTPKADRVAKISCLRWHILAQSNPSVKLSFDLEDYNLFGFKDIVFLESNEVNDFTNAKIINGSSAGGVINTDAFTVPGTEKFYAIGFLTQGLSVDKLANNNNISVYPNPSNGKFTLEVKDATLTLSSITITDAAGQEVYAIETLSGAVTTAIDLSSEAKGIYFIRLVTANGNYSKRVTLF